jgi:membrane protein implicated in regulation of membrane protease activity
VTWWGWLVAGIILLIAEAATLGSFFLCFFSFAALCVGGLVSFDLLPELWHQWSVFTALSVFFTIFLRRRIVALLAKDRTPSSREQFVGLTAQTSEAIQPHSQGKGEFQGVSWNLFNTEEVALSAQSNVIIISREGLTLKVKQAP